MQIKNALYFACTYYQRKPVQVWARLIYATTSLFRFSCLGTIFHSEMSNNFHSQLNSPAYLFNAHLLSDFYADACSIVKQCALANKCLQTYMHSLVSLAFLNSWRTVQKADLKTCYMEKLNVRVVRRSDFFFTYQARFGKKRMWGGRGKSFGKGFTGSWNAHGTPIWEALLEIIHGECKTRFR